MKKAVFFHIGDQYVAFKVIAKLIGYDSLDLPKPNSESINYGLSVSPEFACFPFKMFTGSYIQAAEMKADLIIAQTSYSINACQYSDFAFTQKQILKKKGYKIDMVIVEKFNPKEILLKLKPYKKDLTLTQVTEMMILLSQKISLIDDLDRYYYQIYISESKKIADVFKKKFLLEIDNTDSIIELYKLKKKLVNEFDKYKKIDMNKIMKIAIIGDVYSINVDYMNNNLYDRLADIGVYAEKGHVFTDVVNLALNISNIDSKYMKKAREYMKHNAGGLSLNTIASAIKYADKGYDGVIQIYPFNCMPETVARSILPKVSKDLDLPILYLPIDEQTGDAGFATRIDAFIDLLTMRKEKKIKTEKKSTTFDIFNVDIEKIRKKLLKG